MAVNERRTTDDGLSEPFTSALQAFFEGMQDLPWRSQFPAALFIRDFHELPLWSPHKIGLMMDVGLQPSFTVKVREKAEGLGLHCLIQSTVVSRFILLLDLDADSEGRAWAYLEVLKDIRLTPTLVLSAGDVDIMVDPATGLPVPAPAWLAFLTVVQGVRTGRFDKAERTLRAVGIKPEVAGDLFHTKLGLDVHFGDALEESEMALRAIEVTVFQKPKKPNTHILPLRTRLNRFLFRTFYIYRHVTPLFFTLHGPDGVGKTTACTEVERIFSRLPLPYRSFHHITGWKYPKKTAQEGSKPSREVSKSAPSDSSIVHCILRWVYRRLPRSVQQAYVLASGYDRYLSELNRLIYRHYCHNRIILVDRYIHDLATKSLIEGLGATWIHRLFVRMARPPRKAFVLTDRPEEIRRRKQELSVGQIAAYQSAMTGLIRAGGGRLEEIPVAGRSPRAIARIIAGRILDDCGSALLVLLRAGKVTAEESGEGEE